MQRKLNQPPPAGLWAVCTQAPDRTFGVTFGVGPEQVGFVVETLLGDLVAQLEAEQNTEQAELVREAAAALPRFKRNCRMKAAAQGN